MIFLIFLVSCVVFGITVIGWFAYKLYIWPYYISPLRNIPGPPSENLLYGSFKRFFVEESGEPHLRWVKQYGNISKYHGILNKPILLVTDPKIIQEVLSNQAYEFIKPYQNLADMKALFGQGIALVEGETHKRQRKMMNPAFTHTNVKNMIPTFVRIVSVLRGLIEDEINKGESKIILSSLISKATLDIIGLVGFNHEFNSLTSPSELAEVYDSLVNVKISTLPVIISLLSYYIPFVRKIPIGINNRFNHVCKVIDRESRKLVEEKYRDDKDNKLNGNDLLSLLIKLNKTLPIEEKMSDDELKYQIMTILFAGHETSSTTTSWALHLLAQHPHEQDLLREELVKAFPDKSKFNPTFDEINSLEYLNYIIKETLRLISPVVIIQRYNTKDRIVCGQFIPKDTLIEIPISAIHRLPSIWGPTAENFDPKRWSDPSLTKTITNYHYIPFITGARSCIGNKLALNEIKVLLSNLVRNFVFQPVEGLHIKKKPGFFSKPDPHLELIVSKVEV